MNRFAYARPGSLKAALPLLRKSSPAYAGGVDMLDLMKERLLAPERIVDVKGGALDGEIREVEGGGLRIGALATLDALANHELVERFWPALAGAAGAAATPQIRNVATAAGNLLQRPRCWYFRSRDHHCLKKGGRVCFAQDGENRYHAIFANDPCAIVHPSNLAPALLAYDATVTVVTADGKPAALPVADLFVRPDEHVERENVLDPDDLISEIVLPPESRRGRSAYVEVREKQSFDWALAAAVVRFGFAGGVAEGPCRVVLGQVAPVPWRVGAAEALLTGKAVTEKLVEKVGEAAVRGANPLAQNGYKVQIAKVAVKRAVLQALEG